MRTGSSHQGHRTRAIQKQFRAAARRRRRRELAGSAQAGSERLETRQLLHAAVVGQVLEVFEAVPGAMDRFVISYNSVAGTVTALHQEDPTHPGSTNSPIPIASFNSIHVDTKTNNDSVIILSLPPGKPIHIDTGDGNDVVMIQSTGDDVDIEIDTGSGSDTVVVNNTGASTDSFDDDLKIDTGTEADGITVNNTGANVQILADAGDGDDSFTINGAGDGTVVRRFKGGAGRDTMVINDNNAAHGYLLEGGPDNDFMKGGGSSDLITAEGGDDTVDGGFGPDYLIGGDGIDTLDYSTRTNPITIRVGVFNGSGEAGENDTVQEAFPFEIFKLGAGADTFVAGTTPVDETVYGNGGNDTIDTGAGNDFLSGGEGNDLLKAWDGVAYQDIISGGAGTDTAQADVGFDLVANDVETVQNSPAVVLSFALIDTAANHVIPGYESLTGTVNLNLANLPTTNLGLIANVDRNQGSVVFDLDGTYHHTENSAPYALFGDDAHGDYFSSPLLNIGNHHVTATPFNGANGGGIAGTAVNLTLNITDRSIVSVSRVDSQSNTVGTAIAENEILLLTAVQRTHFNAVATGDGSPIGSVKFILDGVTVRTENTAPYSLFGDNTMGDYFDGTIGLGNHTLEMIPYQNANAQGRAGIKLVRHFSVMNRVERLGTSPSVAPQPDEISVTRDAPASSNARPASDDILGVIDESVATQPLDGIT